MIYLVLIIFIFLTLLFGFQFFLISKSKKMVGQSIDTSKIRSDLQNYFLSEKSIVYFYSPSCTACRYQTPIMDSLKKQNYNVLSIDVSKDLQMVRLFGVMGTPSIAIMHKNIIKDFFVGFREEEIIKKAYSSN